MTAQLSASIAADSFLYSFTPASVGRGGGGPQPSASPGPQTPLEGQRRARAQSVPGEPTYRSVEADDSHSDPHTGSFRGASPSPCTLATLGCLMAGLNPGSSGCSSTGAALINASPCGAPLNSVTAGSAALSALPMPIRSPAPSIGRCGSADRHQQQGLSNSLGSLASLNALGNLGTSAGAAGAAGGIIPVIAGSGGGDRILPPMRHSISGNPILGLPKLDLLPSLAFGSNGGGGGGPGGGPLDLPGLGLAAPGRRCQSGNLTDVASASASYLDPPPLPPPSAAAAFDGSAPPPSSRNGAPAVLAPLRVSGAFAATGAACSGGTGGGGGSPSFPAAGPGATAESAGGGWCSGGGGGGGLYVSSGSRRYTSSAGQSDAVGSFPPSPKPFLQCALDGGVTSPLTPSQLSSNASSSVPPRRSHSLTAKGDSIAADGEQSLDAATSPGVNKEHGSGDGAGAAAAATDSMASTTLSDITDGLQRVAGAFLALHAGPAANRGGPATATATAAAFLPLGRAQLKALKESAPELQWKLRVSVRKLFQVIRQELTAAAPSGRHLGSTVHEAWATLDAYCDGTAELIGALVDRALEAPPPPPPSVSRSSGQQQRQLAGTTGGGGGGGAGFGSSEAGRDLEQLRAINEDLRKQLEEYGARLALAEGRTPPASATSAAAATAAHEAARAGGVGGSGGAGTAAASASPRPPVPPPAPAVAATTATPPTDRCTKSSPRRGKHALVQSNRDDLAVASECGGGAAAVAAGGGSSMQAPAGGAAAAAAVNPPSEARRNGRPTRRFVRCGTLARGTTCNEVVIEEDDSDDDEDDSDEDDSNNAQRHMLTYHSASFAEWVRGARRR